VDRKSVRFTVPLCIIRRVERLNARAGVYALSLATWHGLKFVVQLTALRPTADHFCGILRESLKEQLQKGQMKHVKTFVKTCYSEALASDTPNDAADNEREDGSLLDNSSEAKYLGGLGLKFKFPGDPKK
jgi:TBC1 domain family member 8/9